MKFWVKFGLFLSSYLPLFLILAIKNWYNFALNVILAFVIIYSLVWFIIIWLANKTTTESYKVVRFDDKAKDALSYVIPYIISFISFDPNKWQDVSSIVILLTIIFVISKDTDIIYINPILYFIKYRIYDVEVCKHYFNCEETKSRIVLLTKNKIKKDLFINIRDIDGNVMLEVKNDQGNSRQYWT